MIPRVPVPLSGERFRVAYRIAGGETKALALANDVRNEQTVEFPAALVPPGDIADRIHGQLETFEPDGPGHWRAVISYAVETTGFTLTQFLNVVYGNFSMKTGVRVDAGKGGKAADVDDDEVEVKASTSKRGKK